MPKISALTSLAQASVDTAADVLPIVDATAPATTKNVTVQAMVNAGLAAAAPQGGIFALTGALTVSGQSSFAAGSAAAPSVKVGAEQNGLYSSAANTLDVTCNGVRQAQFAYTALAVNYPQIKGAATGGLPAFSVTGSDTNVSAAYVTKGAGFHSFQTNSGTVQFSVTHTASAVNSAQVSGATTGGAPSLSVVGLDTNVFFNYFTKGSGAHQFLTGGGLQVQVADTTSAVNYLKFTGSGTGSAVWIDARGSDANVSVLYSTRGTGAHIFATANSATTQFVVNHTASAVNYLNLTGAATGNAVSISTGGSDTNRSITIGAAGTGSVIFQAAGASVMAVGQWSGADKALYILNTTTAPSANPTGGGYLYCEGGALKYRGSAGTVTTIAAA